MEMNATRKKTGLDELRQRVITLLQSDRWSEVRTKGSHRQFRHRTKPGTVTVAGKPNVDLPPGTLNSVLKQAGLKN